MKRLLHTPTGMLVRRIALLYVVAMLCRIVFWICNAAQLGPISWAEARTLLPGALKFDTASIVYADGLFILLSLLPLHLRENRRLHGRYRRAPLPGTFGKEKSPYPKTADKHLPKPEPDPLRLLRCAFARPG